MRRACSCHPRLQDSIEHLNRVTHISLSLPAVVERELRVAARKPLTYWGRAGAGASAVLIICFVMLAQLADAPLPLLGQFTFRVLGAMTALTVLVSVLQFSSEAFAREKREDTLGLLFLTPLRPVDMVLGKLAATSLSSFYRFLAIVPVLAVPFLAGGVSLNDFLLLLLALLNLVFLGATVGLWVSARCWDEKRAGAWASSLMVTLVALPAVIGAGLASSWNNAEALLFAALSPGFAVWQAVMPRTIEPSFLAGSLLWVHLLGWLFFLATCRALPRCWQKRPGSTVPKAEHLGAVAPGPKPAEARPCSNPESRPPRQIIRREISGEERRRLLAQNPLAWFALRWKPHGMALWVIPGIALIGYLPALLAGVNANEWRLLISPFYALAIIFLVNMAIKTMAAHYASYAFARDRGEDTMDLLLSTPATAGQMIAGHLHAVRATLQPVLRRALWIESAWLALALLLETRLGGTERILCALGGAALIGLLAPDVRALVWTAMWQSVIRKNAREAQHQAFSAVLVLPWAPTALCWVMVAAFGNAPAGTLALVISWAVSSLMADSYFTSQAQFKLSTRLGLWAVRRSAGEFEHYDGWRHLGRTLGRWWAARRKSGGVN